MTQEIDNNIPLSQDYSLDDEQWLYEEYGSYDECPDLSDEELSEYALMSLDLAVSEMKEQKGAEDSYQDVSEQGSHDENKSLFSLRSFVTFNPVYELGKLAVKLVTSDDDVVTIEEQDNNAKEEETKSLIEDVKELKSEVFPDGISVESVGDALKRGASHVYESVISEDVAEDSYDIDSEEDYWCDEDEYLYCWDDEEDLSSSDAEFYEESEDISWWSGIEDEDAVCYDDSFIEEDDLIEIDDDDRLISEERVVNDTVQTTVVDEPSVYVVAPVEKAAVQHNLFGAQTSGFSAQTYSSPSKDASIEEGLEGLLPISFSMDEEEGCLQDISYGPCPSEEAQSSLLTSEEEAATPEESGEVVLSSSEEPTSNSGDVVLDASVEDVEADVVSYEDEVVEEFSARFVEDAAFLSSQSTMGFKQDVSQETLTQAAIANQGSQQQGRGGILTTNHTQDEAFDVGMVMYVDDDVTLTEELVSVVAPRKRISKALHSQESSLRPIQRIVLAGAGLGSAKKTTDVHDENMLFGQVMVHAGMLMFFTSRNQLGKMRVNNTLASELQSKEFYTVSSNSPTTGHGMQQEKQRHPQKKKVGKKKIVKKESKPESSSEALSRAPLTSYQKPIDIVV
jgi:hypothetical protein